MSNSSFINIESDYEYVLGSQIGNILNLEAAFASNEWNSDELYIIAKELENTGKLFAERQGLGMSFAVESINGTQFSIVNYHKTGNLVNSIHATVENSKIHFYNNAQNSRGQYYAGHIEYGFHDRSGKFIPARPFMRPALYTVAESSKGRLTGALKRFILNGLTTGMGYSKLEFGHQALQSGGIRTFFQQAHMGQGAGKTGYYTSRGLFNSSRNARGHFDIQRNSIFRNALSTNRRTGKGDKHFIGRDNRNKMGNRVTRSTRKFAPNKGRGRPSEGKMSHLRRTGRGRGRPATGQKSRKSTGNPRGRKKGSKNKESNPYKHRTIKRDIKSGPTPKVDKMTSKMEEMRTNSNWIKKGPAKESKPDTSEKKETINKGLLSFIGRRN